jgi:hypothetical protein
MSSIFQQPITILTYRALPELRLRGTDYAKAIRFVEYWVVWPGIRGLICEDSIQVCLDSKHLVCASEGERKLVALVIDLRDWDDFHLGSGRFNLSDAVIFLVQLLLFRVLLFRVYAFQIGLLQLVAHHRGKNIQFSF